MSCMNKLKYALIQAIAVILLGFVVSFVSNALSVNGINPFRRIADVPVVADPHDPGAEGIRFITMEKFESMVQAGAAVIDARTADEYEEGHIPGAVLLDYYDMGRYMERVLPALSPDGDIAIYCSGPDCDDSELLARELYTMGYRNIMIFRGGFEEWVDSGYPVEKGLQ